MAFGKTKTYLFVAITGFVLLLTLLPAHAVIANTKDEDLSRRHLDYLRECLLDKHIDESDDKFTDFNDLWDEKDPGKGGGSDYTGQYVVVGLDISPNTGTQSCKEVLAAGIPLLPDYANQGIEEYFIKRMTGKDDFSISIPKDTMIAQRKKFMDYIDGEIAKLGQPRKAYTANRLGPLISYCYDIQPFAPSLSKGDSDLVLTMAGTKYFFDARDSLSADDLPFIRRNSGYGSSTNAELGDIDLGFSGQAGDVGDFDAFNADNGGSDFYPFGGDLGTFGDYQRFGKLITHTHGDGEQILDCGSIKNQLETGFFSDDIVMSVNAETDAISFGVDTNGDGKPDEALNPIVATLNGNNDETCDSAGALGWIMCPLIKILDGFLNWVDSRVQELLSIDESKYRDSDLRLTWLAVRNLAYLILIPVALVMVIGSAIGADFVSAYTVKKSLPRLLIAIVFITLSWDITGFLIQLSNDVGHGILGLITSPLAVKGIGVDGITLADLYKPSGGFGATTQAAIGGGTILGLGLALLNPATVFALLLFLLSAALTILIAFLILVARQLFILALMIFMPIAILAWIFPGNDKGWKFAWGTFTKLLIMFPLIMALVGTGRVFAFIIGHGDSSGPEGGVLNAILKLVAYVIPYLFIPFTFKAAGGAFGTLVGMANDKSKGAFDRLRKARGNQYKKAKEDLFSSNWKRGADKNSRLGRLNKRLQTASMLHKGGIRPRDFGSNLETERLAREKEHSDHLLKENKLWQQNARDDDLMGGLIEGGGDWAKTREEIKQRGGKARFGGPGGEAELDRLTSLALKMRREAGPAGDLSALRGMFTSSTAFKNSRIPLRNADGNVQRDAEGYIQYEQNPDGSYKTVRDASGKAVAMMNRVLGHHGVGLTPLMVAEMKQGGAQSGRGDMDASFSDILKVSADLRELEHKNGRLDSKDLVTATRSMTVSVQEGNSVAKAVASGKDSTSEAIIPAVFDETEEIMYDRRRDKWGNALPQLQTNPEEQIRQVADALAYEAAANQAAAGMSKAALKHTAAGLRREIDLTQVPDEVRKALTFIGTRPETERKTQTNSKGETEVVEVRTGRDIPVYQPGDTITHSDAIKNMERTSPEMAAAIKVYMDQITSAAMQERSAQQHAQMNSQINTGAGPGGFPPGGGGFPPGGGFPGS